MTSSFRRYDVSMLKGFILEARKFWLKIYWRAGWALVRGKVSMRDFFKVFMSWDFQWGDWYWFLIEDKAEIVSLEWMTTQRAIRRSKRHRGDWFSRVQDSAKIDSSECLESWRLIILSEWQCRGWFLRVLRIMEIDYCKGMTMQRLIPRSEGGD